MSLLGSLQIARNSLAAHQVGLQVVANNIANANTPGYLRQDLVLTPGPTQTIGGLPLGLGVRIEGIVQQADRLLADRAIRGRAPEPAHRGALRTPPPDRGHGSARSTGGVRPRPRWRAPVGCPRSDPFRGLRY